MPILLEARRSDLAGSPADAITRDSETPTLEIGLVNNMPDTALHATERQFIGLLTAAAADDMAIRLHLFSLPGVERGEAARNHLNACYRGLDALMDQKLDALIVTGAEPKAAFLAQEPYWDDFTRLVDWAEHNTASTIWSCLAAHAAVLHLDGIARRPFATKLAGVFHSAPTGDHPLTSGAQDALLSPHSRWNDLAEADLVAHGYAVVTRSAAAGVDVFTKDWRSSFVFLQGHPEYGADSLAREYRRDVGRYLRGERAAYPTIPVGVFNSRAERTLKAFETAARRRRIAPFAPFPDQVMPASNATAAWDASARLLYRNWLGGLVGAQR